MELVIKSLGIRISLVIGSANELWRMGFTRRRRVGGEMGKKTGRSPRSSLEERVATPAQKHLHYQGKKDNFPAWESYHKEATQGRRKDLLEKFRKLEKSLKSPGKAKKIKN